MSIQNVNLQTVRKQSQSIEIGFKNVKRLTTLNCSHITKSLSQIVSEQGIHLVLNFKGIQFIDSTAIRDLNHLNKTACENCSSLAISNAESSVMELIELVKTHGVFNINEVSEPIRKSKVA